MLRNFQLLLKDSIALFGGGLAIVAMIALQYRQFDFALVQGNLGLWFARAEVVLYTIMTALFSFFVSMQIYKVRQFGMGIKKKSIGGWFGGVLGILTVGCPACSITLASFVGLSAFIAFLPFKGLEIKALGILLLLRVNYTMLRDLTICKKR